MATARHFYTPSTPSEKGHFVQNGWLQFFFDYGELPAWLFAIASLAIILLCFIDKRLTPWKKPALAFLLAIAVGAGLITNFLLKHFWLRPRPRQLIEFGGFAIYHPFWIRMTETSPEPGRSFPCGHCTMGFVFFILCLIGLRMQRKGVFYTGIALTILLGIGLSLLRIVQGGHFVSDTLAAALIMWLCAIGADAWVYRNSTKELP